MFCKECGKEVKDNAAICPHCGVPVAAAKPAGASGEVSNHMVGAILVTLFCCLPFGVVSIVQASKVNTRLAQGDIEGAKAASRSAKVWMLWGAGLSLLSSLGWLIFTILGAAGAAAAGY